MHEFPYGTYLLGCTIGWSGQLASRRGRDSAPRPLLQRGLVEKQRLAAERPLLAVPVELVNIVASYAFNLTSS